MSLIRSRSHIKVKVTSRSKKKYLNPFQFCVTHTVSKQWFAFDWNAFLVNAVENFASWHTSFKSYFQRLFCWWKPWRVWWKLIYYWKKSCSQFFTYSQFIFMSAIFPLLTPRWWAEHQGLLLTLHCLCTELILVSMGRNIDN